jgi:hypothetical protein
MRKYSEIHAVRSQTHVCSVNACHPSRSSRKKFGAAAVRACPLRRSLLRSKALVAYVPPSRRSA